MEWVKNIIGMNYFWLITNCFVSPVFAFLFLLHLVYLCLFCISLLLLSFCFPVSFSIPLTLVITCVLIFAACLFLSYFSLLFSWCCLFFFLIFFKDSLFEYLVLFPLVEVMLSCGIVIFHSSPTDTTSVKTVLIIFNIFTLFLFVLLSVLAWAFFNKNDFTVFNTKLIKQFRRVGTVFFGIYIVSIDKIYNLFYVLPFFDLVIQLLNLYPYILNHLFVNLCRYFMA